MSTYTDASLILTPNAVKSGKLYSLKGADLDVVRATTATYIGSDGLIKTASENVPRLDYSNGSCPSILVEPQRTNLLFPSVDNGGVNYDGVNLISKTINFGLAPDGTMTATRILANNASWRYRNVNSTTLINSTTYTFTFWAKSNTLSNQIFRAYLFNQTFSPDFTATQQWQRYTFTLTTPTFGTPVNFHGLGNNSLGTTNIDILTWGWQIEAGANATSYIPTTTTSVTRNADVISKSGISDLIGQTEGTLYWEGRLQGQSFNDGVVRMLLAISDVTINNRLEIYRGNNIIQYDNIVGGAVQFSAPVFTITDFTGQPLKLAITYTLNNVKVFINGVLVNTDTTALIPTCGQTNIGSNRFGSGQWSGLIKNTLLFKTALTNAQAIQLTTL